MRKIFINIIIVMIVLVGAGLFYQSTQQGKDVSKFPAPGKYYDVDGISMHLDCRGNGSPVLIIESGLGGGSSGWSLVHDALASETRVCAYDRPGIDWSAPVHRLADSTEVSNRLFKLLTVAGVEGPKILLGMSAGGVYVREYYKNHPGDIIGMVLIDSSHEQQAFRLPPRVTRTISMDTILINACRLFQPIGVVRGLGIMEGYIDPDLDEVTKQSLLARSNQSHYCSSIYWEQQSFSDEVSDELPPDSLGELPLLVLSRGKEPEAYVGDDFTLEQAMAEAEIWDTLQDELMNLSSKSQRVIAYESGHVIQNDQPDLVIEEVQKFIRKLQSGVE